MKWIMIIQIGGQSVTGVVIHKGKVLFARPAIYCLIKRTRNVTIFIRACFETKVKYYFGG